MIIFIIFRIEFGTFDPNLVVQAVIRVIDRSSRSNEVKEGENYFVCLFLYIEKIRIGLTQFKSVLSNISK